MRAWSGARYHVVIGSDRPSAIRVGIQGGPGSFNEQAALEHLPGILGPTAIELEPLHTTDSVLRAVTQGNTEFGQFAMCNSQSGPYRESLEVLCAYRVALKAVYPIAIRHVLMARPGIALEQLTTILSHDQVFAQCADTLSRRVPMLRTERGVDHYTDPASVAQAIGEGRLPATVATVSNARLADLHGLEILLWDLQDDPNNRSWFVLVERQSEPRAR